jgi:hypothetical protein
LSDRQQIIRAIVLPLIVCCGWAAPAAAKVVQTPSVGIEAVVTVGSPLLERFDGPEAATAKAITIEQDIHVSLGMQGKINIRRNSAFIVEQEKPLKVCTVAQDAYSDGISGGPACLYDTDMDGKFDRTDANVVFTGRRLKEPVPIAIVEVPQSSGGSNFRQTLTYLGTAASVLRVSYREFSGDMARPAFTEELTFPLQKSFPQTIRWRETRITLLGVTEDGLRYRIEP